MFVKNRVNEIRGHRDIQFGYISSKENTADIASRGTTYEKIQTSELWWYGPKWIQDIDRHESVLTLQDKTEISLNENPPCGIDSKRYSSSIKLFRVTALVLRFIKKIKKQKCEHELISSSDIAKSEQMWILHVQKKWYKHVFESIENGEKCSLKQQLGVYIDENGLLRCKGRLENASLSEATRHPLLLPKRDHVTHLIIEGVHTNQLHRGLSQTLGALRYKYWVPSGRATVRRVLQCCILCRKVEGGAFKMPPMSAFPRGRITEATPFTRTGLDYLGPLMIKSKGESTKVWVCLFTCLVTRAVHLEIVMDVSTGEFLLALRRFVARRGVPEEILSDNASQFKLAKSVLDLIWQNTIQSDEVQTYLANVGIKWTFIVERAPWFGGFYERLVGLVKRSLRKTLGHKMLTNIQLQTVITEVESVINSRPLVYMDSDINSNITLTPGHFITLNPKTGIFDNDFDESDPDYDPYESSAERLLNVWNKGQKLLQQFWKIWLDEYLLSLRERTQTKLKSHRVQSSFKPNEGDVVLIKDDLPRGSWKLGKISQLIVSNDGECRSAKVLLATGNTIGRPLNNLYPVEVSNNIHIGKSANPKGEDNPVPDVRARVPRKAAVVARDNMRQLIAKKMI